MKIGSISAVNTNSNTNKISLQNYNNAMYIYPLKSDSFTFSGRRNSHLLTAEEGRAAADKLKSSTSGYRASINGLFNDKLVYSMTNALAKYAKDNGIKTMIVGGDTREATTKYIPMIVEILREKGINIITPKVKNYEGFEDKISPVSTPVLAYAAKAQDIPISVLMTASHNPWEDGGYNFLMGSGAVADSRVVEPLADNLAQITKTGYAVPRAARKGNKFSFNPYELYKRYVQENKLINFDNIRQADIDINYESLNGTGAYYLPRLMSDNGVKINNVLSTRTVGPEPNAKNLSELGKVVRNSNSDLRIGIANDGDADRFGIVDENGNFVSSNDVITLAVYHLIKNRGMDNGTVIINTSTSNKIRDLVEYFVNKEGKNLSFVRTPVGFKYLGGEMEKRENSSYPVILAGEESGGFTIRHHIPEKDGLVAVSTILDLVASEKKNVGEILQHINKDIIGKEYVSSSESIDFKNMPNGFELQNTALHAFDKYLEGEADTMAGYKIDLVRTAGEDNNIKKYKKDGDGIKIYFENGSSLLVRKSGTEPKLRIVVEGTSKEAYEALKNFAFNHVKSAI